MVKYKLLKDGVKDVENHRYIPNSMENRHWVEYQEWLKEGNIPEEMITPAEQLIINEQEFKQEREDKIQTEIRRAAVETLKASGELPVDYKEGVVK